MSDVWPYVAGAYAVTLVLLGGLCIGVSATLIHWASMARREEEGR